MKNTHEAPMIYIGTSERTVAEAKATLLAILATPNAEAVKIEAIRALTTLCNVNNTTITGCSFSTEYNKDKK